MTTIKFKQIKADALKLPPSFEVREVHEVILKKVTDSLKLEDIKEALGIRLEALETEMSFHNDKSSEREELRKKIQGLKSGKGTKPLFAANYIISKFNVLGYELCRDFETIYLKNSHWATVEPNLWEEHIKNMLHNCGVFMSGVGLDAGAKQQIKAVIPSIKYEKSDIKT